MFNFWLLAIASFRCLCSRLTGWANILKRAAAYKKLISFRLCNFIVRDACIKNYVNRVWRQQKLLIVRKIVSAEYYENFVLPAWFNRSSSLSLSLPHFLSTSLPLSVSLSASRYLCLRWMSPPGCQIVIYTRQRQRRLKLNFYNASINYIILNFPRFSGQHSDI